MKESILRDEIIQFAADQYGTQPEHLWVKYPNYVVLRHNNKKWYAIIMDVPRQKLGMSGNGVVDVIDLKIEPLLVSSLLLENGFLPAYHMNKGNWLTILLDGTVDREQITNLLDMSHKITGKIKNARKEKRNRDFRRNEK